jgi:hypothetical protein
MRFNVEKLRSTLATVTGNVAPVFKYWYTLGNSNSSQQLIASIKVQGRLFSAAIHLYFHNKTYL